MAKDQAKAPGKSKFQDTSTRQLSQLLEARERPKRLQILAELQAKQLGLPLVLVRDLLLLDVGIDEKLALLERAMSPDNLALEQFYTESLIDWPQDLAQNAVFLWYARTEHRLWHRLVDASKVPHLPQRVLFSIIEHADKTGGAALLQQISSSPMIHELSQATMGLILHKAVQWSVATPHLGALAERAIKDLKFQHHSDHKATPAALVYMLRFYPESASGLAASLKLGSPLREILLTLLREQDTGSSPLNLQIKSLGSKQNPQSAWNDLKKHWPALWYRHSLNPDDLELGLSAASKVCRSMSEGERHELAVLFSGIPLERLEAALCRMEPSEGVAILISCLEPLLMLPYSPHGKALINKSRDYADAAAWPARLRAVPDPKGPSSLFEEVLDQERQLVLQDNAGKSLAASFQDFSEKGAAADNQDPLAPDNRQRRNFFDVAYRKLSAGTPAGEPGLWSELLEAWSTPKASGLTKVAARARQAGGIFNLCYLDTLGRFRGEDQAALKLLDFIRTQEEDELRAVIRALGGIGTPRAMQELVATLTRPNTSANLRLLICQILQEQNLSGLQSELRSALKDLSSEHHQDGEVIKEVRDALSNLIEPVTPSVSSGTASQSLGISDSDLDQALVAKIQHYKILSSEVKRALRTAQFFHIQVDRDDAPGSIDLSPVIDMQYKALELLFRESFEEICTQVIHRGGLQRRLDIIGYARPIPRAMDDFENYIASLPTINNIPFFSKFKLRKMLRAICQFRPGRRFTLDGLKAFALFFLCFSRKDCRYGLTQIFDLGFTQDEELFEFVRVLHVFQDFRNRAAHEGFHPDASNDINGIWMNTAQIVQTMHKTKTYLDKNFGEARAHPHTHTQQQQGAPSQAVIIEKKRVS